MKHTEEILNDYFRLLIKGVEELDYYTALGTIIQGVGTYPQLDKYKTPTTIKLGKIKELGERGVIELAQSLKNPTEHDYYRAIQKALGVTDGFDASIFASVPKNEWSEDHKANIETLLNYAKYERSLKEVKDLMQEAIERFDFYCVESITEAYENKYKGHAIELGINAFCKAVRDYSDLPFCNNNQNLILDYCTRLEGLKATIIGLMGDDLNLGES